MPDLYTISLAVPSATLVGVKTFPLKSLSTRLLPSYDAYSDYDVASTNPAVLHAFSRGCIEGIAHPAGSSSLAISQEEGSFQPEDLSYSEGQDSLGFFNSTAIGQY